MARALVAPKSTAPGREGEFSLPGVTRKETGMQVNHREIADRARLDGDWYPVKEYPNRITAQSISGSIRRGVVTAYGTEFITKVHGTTVFVKWEGKK